MTLSIDRGDCCALTGPSGSGKTTLLNLVGLLDRPTSGEVMIDGRKTSRLSVDQAAGFRNQMIGYVFQSFHLLPRYSALDNVALPLIYRGLPKSRRTVLASVALEKVGLADRLMHRPDELSGGQRQRVAIARALVGDPSLLLADEPTGNLDTCSADAIVSLFMELNAELGLTIIIVTHDPTVAARCSRRIVMRDGKIQDDSSSYLKSVR